MRKSSGRAPSSSRQSSGVDTLATGVGLTE